MAKQSIKQQIYQSIANSQVKQIRDQQRQQAIAQLQADFDAWNQQQQGIAALQAEYDAWQKAQTPAQEVQPVQQKTVSEIKQIPTLEKKSREEIEAFRNEKIAKREAVLNSKKEKLIDNPFMDNYFANKTTADLGKSADDVIKKYAEVKGISEEQARAEYEKAEAMKNQSIAKPGTVNQEVTDKAKVDLQTNKYLDTSNKLSDVEKKEAREFAQSELAKFNYGPDKKPLLMTDEDRQHYADMVNILNKTSGVANAMAGVIKQPLNVAKTVRDVGRNVGDQLSGLGAAVTDKMGVTEGATQRHNEKVAARDSLFDQNYQSVQKAYENAKAQKPVATTAGEIGGQIGMYMLTNPLFDSLGAAAGLGKAGSFALNQVGQNAQDLALDTIPALNQYLDDGTVSDEERKALLANVGLNAAGNLVMGGVGLGIDALKAKKAAKAIPGIEDVDNVVRNATKQAEEAATNIDNIAKKYPVSEMASYEDAAKNVLRVPDDIKSIAANNMSEIKNMDSVSTVKGSMFKGEGSLLDKVTAFFNAKGGKAYNDILGDVDLTRRGVKDSISHNKLTRRKVDAFAAVPDVIEKGKLVAYEPNWKGRGYDTALIAAPTKVQNPDGSIEDFITGVIVRRDKDSQRFYTHDAVSINRKELSLETGTPSQGQNTRGDSSFSVYNILRKLADDKYNTGNIAKETINNIDTDDIRLSDAEINRLLSGMEPTEDHTKALTEMYKSEGYSDDQIKQMVKNPTEAEIERATKAAEEVPITQEMSDKLMYDFDDINNRYYGSREAIRKSLESKDFSIPDAAINTTVDKKGKTVYQVVDAQTQRPIRNYTTKKAAEKAQAEFIAGDVPKARALKALDDMDSAIHNYEKAAYNATDVEEVNTAKKALEATRKRYERAMKDVDPSYYDSVSGKDFADSITQPYYTRNPKAKNPINESVVDDIVNDWIANENSNKWVRDAEPIQASKRVPGANPLQTFAKGPDGSDWKISGSRTNTIERLGWGNQMPEKDFAYRVYHRAEQNADAIERYKDSKNVVADLMNRGYDEFDAPDVKMAFNEAQRLMDQGDKKSIVQAQRLMTKTAAVRREGARVMEAGKEFLENSPMKAISDAIGMSEDTIVNPWKAKNKKAVAGNSRIAKALADMGHKPISKVKPELTHDQIKNGVIAELNKEVGSVEQYFNNNDIEFLTTLAEDKSIPVWQITSEIEHKLNTGNWYSLDESLPIPKPTNTKLQSALNSLIEKEVRAEKAAPDLKQITEEVRNTLAKESADFDGQFTDDDIDYLANLINEGATKNEIADALNTKLATGSFGISDETLQQVNAIFKEISNFDPNSKQFVEGQLEAYRLLANEVVGDATPLEKFEAWRYLAMLGNPKTMIRNFVGNQTFGVVTGVSNNLAALAEAGIDKGVRAMGGEGIQRTKSILNPLKDMDLIKAAAEDADASRYRQIIGSKYEKLNQDTLRQQKSVFNSKLLQLYEKATDAGISDYQAVKNKFSTSLAGYLKANGYDTSIFKAEDELRRLKNLADTQVLSDAQKASIDKLTKDVAELEKARDFALKQAEYATFHEDNAVATALTRASNFLRKSDNKVLNAGGAMLEGVVPFKKTPANVLRSGIEYSPLGAIDSIKKTGKLIYENTGKRAGNLADTYINSKGKEVAKTLASDVIDSWSKTLTGSGLTALGFYLFDKGILNSSDPDTKYQDQLEGKQNYSITINGKTYTIDWAAPTAMPLLLGAEIAKVWRDSGNDVENWYDHLDEYLNAANRLADPLIETSMLQGVKDSLETAANAAKYDENLNIPTLLMYNAATGFLTQGVPTIAGQIARTVDNTRRSTYTDKEGVAGTLEKQGRKLMNKIPGLSQLNQPYIDTYGREQKNSPFDNPLANLAYQMASPGYLADINETPADTMTRDVYEKSGKSDNILAQWKSYFKDSSGKRVSPEQYTAASRVYGELQAEVRNTLANDEWFNGLNDAERAEIVDDINTLASNVAKSSIDPEFTSTSKPYQAYKEGGLQGLMDHFKNRQASTVAQESGLNSSTKAAEAIKEDVMNGNMEAAQEKIDAATSLQSLGLDKPGPAATYYNAQSIIPGLTTEDFAKTYKAIDTDGNQGIKQDELIAYLNKYHVSASDANKLWKAYGSSSWKSIPSLDEFGVWKKKTK